MQRSSAILFITISVLLVVAFIVGHSLVRGMRTPELRVSFLDVGQGDAIFIEAPGGRQMLIDGGKNRSVIRQLATVMPWYDRTIDVVLATHPDADHIGGLPDVFKRYRVGLVIESSVRDEEGADAQAFEKAAAAEGAERLVAERGQVIDVGEGARLEILFPDRSVPGIETNTGSIVARLVYGETAFMLTGDSPKEIEDYLVRLDGKILESSVLKAGHHGSRTSSSFAFVGFVSPEYAVYSRGCDNSYGHPHDEVKEMFAKHGVPTLDTCEDGSITFVSDGKTVVRK
ncbi:MBL fold metallo-hydrolase [bacterium]|nr:MBL fold metallo-hydrolase [bacterium]